jgi:hypothetical protein
MLKSLSSLLHHSLTSSLHTQLDYSLLHNPLIRIRRRCERAGMWCWDRTYIPRKGNLNP